MAAATDAPSSNLGDHPDLRSHAERMLQAMAGSRAHLREDQWTAITALVVHRRRALVVQRTGWGKSAVYFIAAALLRAAGHGPTVIVSPLLALMRNQVAAAQRSGIVAVTINSGNVAEWDDIHARVAQGVVDVLLVSPERLNNPDFRDRVLPRLAADAGLVVIDEAHCVSDWGHDFRPDYRRIRTLIADLGSDVPVLATTATATDRVVTDIATQIGADTMVLRGALDRESLHLSVLRFDDAVRRTAWLAEYLNRLPGCGIVYALTVAAAHDLADVLRTHGHAVAAYTGRTDPAEREALETALLNNEVKALVATSALGMGFDKPDLGFVVHIGAPSSPIAYYQQVGRAGRSTHRADVVLLPGPEDKRIWSYFDSVAFPREHIVRAVLDALDADRPLSTVALEPLVDLNRTRLDMVLKVLDVDGAVRRVRGGWIATGRPWSYETERYERLSVARAAEQQAMIDYQTTAGCRMEFLRRQLDDPELPADPADSPGCGRCDNCTGTRPDPVVATQVVATTRARLERPGVDIVPRKQWPTAVSKLGVPLSGKITAGANTGRTLGRLTDFAWGPRLRALLDGPDAPIPDDVFDACVTVLRKWDWATRPTSVLTLESTRNPVLTATLARRLAAVGRLRDLGTLRTRRGRLPVAAANSAHRVAGLYDSWDVPDLTDVAGPILLVNTVTDTGWTFTVAASALRAAGADAVLPFALATPT
ncbi:ATP-dependent DNA helicase RecQ [Nocardia sp. CNY236]|uniref:RecQ family ATP-dependent DNA helicase n=1 Tax=Nocardia sp. CNY236 TaxID=1169152 RepID=UPI0004189B30